MFLPTVQTVELFVVDVLHGDGTHGLAVFLPIIQPVELFVGSMLVAWSYCVLIYCTAGRAVCWRCVPWW